MGAATSGIPTAAPDGPDIRIRAARGIGIREPVATAICAQNDLTALDCLEIESLDRLVPRTDDPIVTAGRQRKLGDRQVNVFVVSGNRNMLRDYLTASDDAIEQDSARLDTQGMVPRPPPHPPHPPCLPPATRGAETDLAGLMDKPVAKPLV